LGRPSGQSDTQSSEHSHDSSCETVSLDAHIARLRSEKRLLQTEAAIEEEADIDEIPCWNVANENRTYPFVIQQAFRQAGIPCSFNSNGFVTMSEKSKLEDVKFRGYCCTSG
jgi:hypothetical protein